jgi:hypothetical protein
MSSSANVRSANVIVPAAATEGAQALFESATSKRLRMVVNQRLEAFSFEKTERSEESHFYK